jgi:PAS domain S-box-containing protein
MKDAIDDNRTTVSSVTTPPSNPLKDMKLGVKFALMAAVSVLVTAAALVFLALWQSDLYNDLAQNEVEMLIESDLNHITQGVLNLVRTENEAVQSRVDDHLNLARHVLTDAGDVTLSKENVRWAAINQFTQESTPLDLPKLLVGGTWLGQNDDFSENTPIVDDVTGLVGETATIFQRINDAGDMLRIATTVKSLSGSRAIGTYIPAINPDGTENEVVATILGGETYHGRAYVVNSWYLTAYEPLKNSAGDLVGMLYVGVKQKAVESRVRNAILNTTVGKTGYVYVLGGSGNERGHYIISQNGARDGEDIWLNQDSDGRYVIQEIIQQALTLEPNEMSTIRYRWENPGDPGPRWKIAHLAYYKPWDWVIGTSVYEDELQTYQAMLTNGRLRMMQDMTIAGIIITFLVVLVSVLVTFKISRPIRQMTRVAEKICCGDLNQLVDVRSHDDIGILARTFNLMTTELKQSMEYLKKSEEKYRLIFENALEGLFQTNLEGRIISANPALAGILGYDSPEALISEITNLGHHLYNNPEEREKFISILAQEGEVVGFEVQSRRRDNVNIWISISARLVLDDTGAPTLIEGFISDINDRKQAEEALAESKNYLNEIFNTVADPMFVKNQRHQWVLVNDAMCAFVGHTREELLGKCEYDFFRSEEADIFRSIDDTVLATGEENINEEIFTDPKGQVHTLVTKKSLYTDKNGEKHIVAVIRDVTSQKSAEEEKKQLEVRLSQAQKMEAIGTLAGGIAHDFNNILSAIIGYTELAQDNVLVPDGVRKHLQEVLKASDRAKELVKQILTFSRMTETEYSPIALRSVVKESLKMLRSVIPSTIEIRQNLTASGLVMSDPTQINQIVMNLCTNAVHSMDKTGGKLEVSLSEVTIETPTTFNDFTLSPGPYLNLVVRDTGKGIPREIMARIFEPYFTTKEQGRGTGLGLSVIHGIITSHKGAITCQSLPEKGTTFSIYLPMIRSGKTKEVPPQKPLVQEGNERILYVDDELILAKMANRMLSSRGYKVVSITDSLDALELFRKSPDDFDLVITDMTMPGLTGDSLAGKLIEIRKDIPVILCTGYSEHISEDLSEEIGIRAFVLKPLNIRTLTETVRKVLDQR